jgi:zinc protease
VPSMFHASILASLLFGPPDPVFEPVEIPALEFAASFERRTFENDPIGVQQFVLANGLTVLLSENHERPQVFGAVVVRTGGKNDPPDNTGMAHYLEHMLFKGTKTLGTSNWAAEGPLQAKLVELYERHKRADSDEVRAKLQAEIGEVVAQTYAYVIPNELSRMLGELGSTGVNAFTGADETVYHNTFPASQIESWLEIYAHRFVDPVFRLFPTELEAVYEEKNGSLETFEAKLFEEMNARAFPQHPYGTQSVIGEVEHLKSPSLLAMQAYFDEYYVANNMALVLVGDFDSEAILPLVARHFGPWRSGPEPEPRTGLVEPFEGRELVELRLTPIRVGAHVFRTPTARDPDHAAVQVMRELLFNEQDSGLINDLANEGKVLMTHWFPLDYADHSVNIVFFAPRVLGQTFKSAEKRMRAQYGRIARGEFDEREMLAIRDRLLRAEDRQWEYNHARALAMADSFIRHDGWQGYLDYRERLAAVSREDVMRVAETYLGEDYLTVHSRVGFPKKPRLKKPGYPTVTPQPNVRSDFYEHIMARPSPAPKLRFVDFDDVATTQTADNVVLRTNVNSLNDTYTLTLVFGVGTARIRELFVAAPYLERIGTRTHSPAALREQLSLLGTDLSIEATDDQLRVQLTGPEQHLTASLELLEGLLREPVVDEKLWKQLRRERAASDTFDRELADALFMALIDYVKFGERSDYLRDYGPRGLRSLNPEGLIAAWHRAQGYGLEVRYTGQRQPDEVDEILSRALAGSLDVPREPAVSHVVRERVLPERDTVYFMPQRKHIQTQMAFIVDGDPVPREQIAAADAYSQYMGGGMDGLVFQEVREFRALAYAAASAFVRDEDFEQAGWLGGWAACQADKTFETLDVMMGLIRDMPVKPEGMDAIRSALSRRLETQSPGFRDLQDTLERWGHMGYREDPRTWLLDHYEMLEFADIEAFHAAQVAGRPVITIVVGDPRRVDVDELARYGEVIEVAEHEVFAR